MGEYIYINRAYLLVGILAVLSFVLVTPYAFPASWYIGPLVGIAMFVLIELFTNGLMRYSIGEDALNAKNLLTGRGTKIRYDLVKAAACRIGTDRPGGGSRGMEVPTYIMTISYSGGETELHFEEEAGMMKFAHELEGHIGGKKVRLLPDK